MSSGFELNELIEVMVFLLSLSLGDLIGVGAGGFASIVVDGFLVNHENPVPALFEVDAGDGFSSGGLAAALATHGIDGRLPERPLTLGGGSLLMSAFSGVTPTAVSSLPAPSPPKLTFSKAEPEAEWGVSSGDFGGGRFDSPSVVSSDGLMWGSCSVLPFAFDSIVEVLGVDVADEGPPSRRDLGSDEVDF